MNCAAACTHEKVKLSNEILNFSIDEWPSRIDFNLPVDSTSIWFP